MSESTNPPTVMLEKWMLVVLIVGCTSLVFIICFPIDFYLYRRRKRLARKTVNMLFYQAVEAPRAGQMHSSVSVDVSVDDYQEHVEKIPPDNQERQLQSRFVRLINLFRRQKREKLLQLQQLSLSTTSEVRSEMPTLTVTSEQFEGDKGLSVSSASTCRTDDNLRESQNNINIVGGTTGQTVANIENDEAKTNIPDIPDIGHGDIDNFTDDKTANLNYSLTKETEDTFYGAKFSQISVTNKQAHCVNIEIKECVVDENNRTEISVRGTVSDESNVDIVKDGPTIVEEEEEEESNVEIIEVQSSTLDQDHHRAKAVDYINEIITSEEKLGDAYIQSEHKLDQKFRKLKSEPNLNLMNNEKLDVSEAFEPLSISYSELSLGDHKHQQGMHVLYDPKRHNVVTPTDDEVDAVANDDTGKRKKRSKRLGKSEEGVNINSHKRKRKKMYSQRCTVKSLPDISIDDTRDNYNRQWDLFD